VIVQVSRQTRSGAGDNFGMRFFPCSDVAMYFAHLVSLTPAFASQVGAFTTCDQPYTSGGVTSTECRKEVEIHLTAGTVIGTAGGPSFPGIDFGGADRRAPTLQFVNPGRSYGSDHSFGQNNTICPLDYFVVSVGDALRARLGRGAERRTIAPICGSVMQDVVNTAQGRWYFDNSVQEDPHLALAHENVDPRLGVISSGTSIPSLTAGARIFTPVSTGRVPGRVNTDFSAVTADGFIYCYETFSPSPPPPARHVLVQLVSPTRVRIEGVTGALCGDPSSWAFTTGAREFSR
jgi:hypothetical protein